ncbi:hypothetical protein M7I_6997 [Glarea lozoyensis 74030]|uniref:Uncharacterized protein n=1 Tax=Glarea lozoyensis (strain ATCC 74030 / MF5533) TaxID=1104152 RepID=H0EW21_GLAL7|nr:hypothetical protein M7I_6997 [Glarea lozoyensis 74030]
MMTGSYITRVEQASSRCSVLQLALKNREIYSETESSYEVRIDSSGLT